MLTWTLRPWQRALIARLEVPAGLIREIAPRPVFLEHAIVSNRLSGVSSQNAHPQHAKRSRESSPTCARHAPATSTPRRVLICRGLDQQPQHHQSGGDDRGAESRSALSRSSRTSWRSTNRRLPSPRRRSSSANSARRSPTRCFCRPGTKVVEIIAEGQHDPWSSHLLAMLGLEHVVLFQRQSEEALANAPRHVKDLPFAYAVDVPKLVETVKTRCRLDGVQSGGGCSPAPAE